MEAFQEERELYLMWLECSVHSVHDDDVREALVKMDHAIRDAVAEFIAHHAEMLGIDAPHSRNPAGHRRHMSRRRACARAHEGPGSVPDDLFGTILLLIYGGLESLRPAVV